LRQFPPQGIIVIRALLLLAGLLMWSSRLAAHPQTPSQEEVLRALSREDLPGDRSLNFEVEPWDVPGATFVALMYIDAGEVVRTKRLQPTLSVLKESDGKLTLIAEATIDEPHCRELPEGRTELEPNLDGEDCPELHLDLAPYKISSSDTALGVRTKIHAVFPAGESETEELTLFHIVGGTLKPIFSAEMNLRDEQRGPGDATRSESTLRISDHQTSGHFDLLLTERSHFQKLLDPDDEGRSEQIRRRFRWRGNGYTAAR
jgi:hypothetical protein